MLRYYWVSERRLVMPGTTATNIRLPEDLLKTLRHRAIEEKKSMNQLIREAIEMSLAIAPQSEEHRKDSFEDVIGIARSGIKDASSKHDRYLYRRK
jgi:Ribbon-helix-helix protein, copG family